MIIIVYGPKLAPTSYTKLEQDIRARFVKKSIDARGFHNKDVRIFFPLLAQRPASVEVAMFGGTGSSTTMKEAGVWKHAVEECVAPYYPKLVINGFIVTLDTTAQFTSVFAYAQSKT